MPDAILNSTDIAEVLPETAPTSGGLRFSDVSEVLPETAPASGLQILDVAEVLPGDAPKETTLDEFRTKSDAELEKDSDFSPVPFGAKNREALLNDPPSFEKLSRLYQKSETRGTTIGQKIKAAFFGIPAVASAIGSGIAEGIEKAADLNPIAITGRIAGAASMGDIKSEIKKIVGEEAEVLASVETAGAGTADLLRRSGRAVKEGVGKILPGVSSKAELSGEEWKARLRGDIAGLEQVESVGRGSGEVMKALGTDAEELAKVGITVNPETIAELSVVTDPVNFVPFGAAVGAVGKVAGKLGTRVLATAATAEQAAQLAKILNTARKVASKGGTIVGKVTGATVSTVGKGVEKTGEVAEKVVRSLGGAGGGIGLGGILGHDVYSALGGGLVAKAGPRIVQAAGRGIQATGKILSGARPVPAALSVAGDVGKEFTKGAAEGAVLILPFELGARPDEEQNLLGAVGIGGLARAGVTQVPRAARAASRAAQDKLAESIFKETEFPETVSATYGTDPNLDTNHTETAAKLDPRSRNLLNFTRERFRNSGVEFYALDDSLFAHKSGTGDAYGFFMHLGERIDNAGNATPVLQIFLNGTTDALPHELAHALYFLDPGAGKNLSDSVVKSWTPEQKSNFTEHYNTLRNGGLPKEQWKHILDDAGVAEEAGAEVFSRLYLGQDLSRVSPDVTKSAALFLSSILEKLGAPLGRVGAKPGPGVSTLGVRPGVEATKIGQQWLSNISDRLTKRGTLLSETPTKSKLLAGATPADITKVTTAPTTPPVVRAPTPKPVVPPVTNARNIRVTKQQQDDFAARRAAETGIETVKPAASKLAPEAQQHFQTISDAMETGSPVVEIEHLGVKTGEEVVGRTQRRAEQEAAYLSEGAAATPTEIREAYQKTFVPVRWETAKGKPQLLAMSLDKVLSNVHRVVKDSAAKGVETKLPYEITDGKLTDNGWGQIVDDLQSYAANQANGYRGDGGKLVRPKEDIGVSIPAENPAYNPVRLTEERMNFLNLVQGLNPPLTARVTKGTPGNIKAQLLSELQGRTPEKPTVIRPEDITKQEFKGTGRSVMETNPLRNELAAAGVPVRELIEVTERINAEDITKSASRPDINFQAPVTDIIRAGFLPGKETIDAVRAGLLPDSKPSPPTPSKEIRDLAVQYAKVAGIEYQPARNFSSVNPDLAKRIADFYDAAKSDIGDPAVAASYQALADETLAQYKVVTDAGYVIEPFSGQGEPYKSSANAVADIRDNKHLFFLKSDPRAFEPGNIMISDAGNGFLVNDVFRAVHDFFGHGKEGYQFGPRGEFNAWRAHSELFTPAAQGALAAETLAQNSWVNFGKHLRDPQGNIPQRGQPGYVALTERPFATQKAVVIPENLIQESRAAAKSEPKFLPDNKSIEEFGKEILLLSPDDWRKATESWDGGLTGQAYRLGLDATDRQYVETLKSLRDESLEKIKSEVAKGDLDTAMTFATKSQLFAEAYQAATGAGQVRTQMQRLGMDESKIPFPDYEKKFLPKTGQRLDPDVKFLPAASMPEGVDAIDTAAIRTPSGRVFTGSWHGEALMNFVKAVSEGRIDERPPAGKTVADMLEGEIPGFLEDGFVTRSGKFLNRAEALDHAEKIGQLKEEFPKEIAISRLAPTFRESGILESTDFSHNRAFLPKTEAGKAVEAQGFKFKREPHGSRGGILFTLSKDKKKIGEVKGYTLSNDDKVLQGVEEPDKKYGKVTWVEVDDKYSDKGLGEALLREFLSEAQFRGWEKLIGGAISKGGKRILEKAFSDVPMGLDFIENRSELPLSKGGYESFQYEIPTAKEVKFLPSKRDELTMDAQGRPLTAEGLVDYEKLYKDLAAERAAQSTKRDKALEVKISEGKYKMPDRAVSAGKRTGWILPNKEFVPLDSAYHERFLADNSKELNSQFGTELGDKPNIEERLGALNKGFVRVRYVPQEGALRIEANASRFPKLKSEVIKQIEDGADEIDRLFVSLLDDKGGDVDSVLVNVAELDGPEKLDALLGAVEELRTRKGKFLPGKYIQLVETLPGFNIPSEEQAIQQKFGRRIKIAREKFPETLPIQYRRDDGGNYVVKSDGKPAPIAVDYDLMSSSLAKTAAKGLRGVEREEAFSDALSKQLSSFYKKTSKNPDVAAGVTWYSTARTRLKKVFGDDSKFFAELLGATSARTPAETNFRFALDAYNQFKQGKFDDLISKYREGKQKWETGDVADFLKTWKNEKPPNRGQFLDWWIRKNDLGPTQSNGKKFGANSRSVLRVLDGSWASEVKGPKTPNFAGNLSGQTFEATIDIWAMRTLHRLANEGKKDRWRILPENETGVSDTDFYIGQKTFRKTADALGIKPDALQAILWFAEKDLWEKRGWTRGVGAEKSDFNILLKEAERGPAGEIQLKTPQMGLDLLFSEADITPKKK